MQCGDGPLLVVRVEPAAAQRAFDPFRAFGDLSMVPQAAVLPVEQQQITAGVAVRRASRVRQQHQREQADCFRLGQ
jgi:hypothetical protein